MADEPVASTPEAPAPKGVTVPSGRALTLEQLSDVLGHQQVARVVLVGPAEAGKTTILAELFHRFLAAPFAGFDFAGSSTLNGFEERCHLSRLVSAEPGSKPDTKRTPVEQEEMFLHLSLVEAESRARYELLMSDISGEDFAHAAVDQTEAKKLTFLPLANRISIVIDGAVVKEPARRHTAYAEQVKFLRMAATAGVLPAAYTLQFVVTKFDLLSQEAAQWIDARLQAQAEILQRDLVGMRYARKIMIAARPEDTGAYNEGDRLDALLRLWMFEEPNTKHEFPTPENPGPRMSRFAYLMGQRGRS